MVQDEFISTISHEIRTPLTSIKGFSQTMLDNWDSLDVSQKKKFLTIINEQSQRLINLVENVLNVAKIEGQESDFVLKEINLEFVVRKTLELFKDRDFIVHSFKAPTTSLCDQDLLEHILVNIIENACKYSKEAVEISFSTERNFNLISIKDRGCGIRNEDLEKVFDKFYRADNCLTSKTQGSGLGLYIAKKLAKKMKGNIVAKSSGQGSEFIVYLPVFEIETLTSRGRNV